MQRWSLRVGVKDKPLLIFICGWNRIVPRGLLQAGIPEWHGTRDFFFSATRGYGLYVVFVGCRGGMPAAYKNEVHLLQRDKYIHYSRILSYNELMKFIPYYLTTFVTAGLWFLADYFTKQWAQVSPSLPWGDPSHLFYLSQVTHNTGIAFGLPVPRWIQIIGTILILAFLFYMCHLWLQKNKKWFLQAFLFGIVLGGALGNFWDRILQGRVVDFIVLKPFPNFNIADIGISVGLAGLIALNFYLERREMKNLKFEK